jgi:hypothetical protein
MPHPHEANAGAEPLLSAAARNAASRRAALRSENSRAARAALAVALIALAEEELAHGREAATVAALAEAGTLFPKRLPEDPASRGRFVMLQRTKAVLAQKQERQADAVEAYEAALSAIPADLESASRDDNAARLQLLVRLARSRLAIGDAAAVASEMQDCEALMAALDGEIPARALDAVRAAVLGHTGVAKAMLGEFEAAGAKLAESLALLDRLAVPELADLRRQVLSAWSNVLRRGGGDPSAILARAATADKAPDESCGCGHPHAHDHDHCTGHGHHHGHSHEGPTHSR